MKTKEDQISELEQENKRLRELAQKNEDHYAELWQMYGDLENDRDQMWEALIGIRDLPEEKYDIYRLKRIANFAIEQHEAILRKSGNKA